MTLPMLKLWLEGNCGAVDFVVVDVGIAGFVDYYDLLLYYYHFSDQPPRFECPHCALNGNDAKIIKWGKIGREEKEKKLNVSKK